MTVGEAVEKTTDDDVTWHPFIGDFGRYDFSLDEWEQTEIDTLRAVSLYVITSIYDDEGIPLPSGPVVKAIVFPDDSGCGPSSGMSLESLLTQSFTGEDAEEELQALYKLKTTIETLIENLKATRR